MLISLNEIEQNQVTIYISLIRVDSYQFLCIHNIIYIILKKGNIIINTNHEKNKKNRRTLKLRTKLD